MLRFGFWMIALSAVLFAGGADSRTYAQPSITIENQFPEKHLDTVRVPLRVVSTTTHKGKVYPPIYYNIEPVEPCSIGREQCTLSYYGLPEYNEPRSRIPLWAIVLFAGIVLIAVGSVLKK